MKHIDYLQVSLAANVVAIIIVIVTAAIVAWNNAGSKNIPLASAALIGVMVGYLIQLPFELRRSTSHETLGAQFTIDRAQPVVRQWVYPNDAGWRIGAEVEASNWLAKNHPAAFDGVEGRDKVVADMVIFSLLSFLTHVEYDWQMQRSSYGELRTFQGVSKPEECSSYDETALNQLLKSSGNAFADVPLQILTKRLCLPPNTKLEISKKTLTFRYRFCELVFAVEQPVHNILNVDPKTREFVPLPNGKPGEPRYEIRIMGLNLTTTFFALRAQHRDSQLYHDWASRVANGVRLWFAPGNRAEEPQQYVPH